MSLPAPSPVREYGAVDRTVLDRDIRPLRQPAVLRGLAADWPAVAAAKRSDADGLGYLRAMGGAREVSAILGGPEIAGRFFYTPDLRALNFQRGRAPFDVFLARLLADRERPSGHAMAVQSEMVPALLPGFAEANRTALLGPDVAPRIWIGNAIKVATHYDLKENIGVVVAGRRRFTLYPPEQIANLYPGPFELTPAGTPVSMVDPDAPDLDRYPRFAAAAATAQVATLEPSDALYIPFHWWHGVESLDDVNVFVNYWWNAAAPGTGNAYDALMHALYALRPLPDDQRAAWRAVFDHYVFGASDPAPHLPEHAKGVLGTVTPALLERMRGMLRQIAQRI